MDVTEPATDGRSSRWDEHRLARRAELVEATLLAIRTHCFFFWFGDLRDLHGYCHSFPTRRSSDLQRFKPFGI